MSTEAPALFEEISDTEIDVIFAGAQSEQPIVHIERPIDETRRWKDLEGLVSSMRSIDNSAMYWRTRALRAESGQRMRSFLGGQHGE